MKGLLFILSLVTLVQSSFSSPRSPSEPDSKPTKPTGFSLSLLHIEHPTIQRYLPQSVLPVARRGNDNVYFVTFLTGSNYFERRAVFDTGSSFTWVNVSAEQDDPRLSKTYKKIPCSGICYSVPTYEKSCSKDNECYYQLRYADGTESSGVVGYDNFLFFNSTAVERHAGSKLVPVEVLFGSQRQSAANPHPGVMGVGGGPLGILELLNVNIVSMCFPPKILDPGSVGFGTEADFGSIRRGMTNLTYDGARYRFKVNASRIQGIQVKIPNYINTFIFDTGAGMTYLQPAILEVVLDLVKRLIDLVPNVGINGYHICYDPYYKSDYDPFSFNFEMDGSLQPLMLQFFNIWVYSGYSYCLAFGNSSSDTNIFGMRQMQATNFVLDLPQRKLRYDRRYC